MKGFVYPLRMSHSGIDTTGDYNTLVRGAILSSLNTAQEERVMRPEYGRTDEEFQTTPTLTGILSNCRSAVEIGLEDYPDVSFQLLGQLTDDGIVLLEVIYQCPDGIEESLEVLL